MTKRIEVPYWIVVNWTTRAIWKQPFQSIETARSEMQMLNRLQNTQDWIMEKRVSFIEVDEFASKTEEFSKF